MQKGSAAVGQASQPNCPACQSLYSVNETLCKVCGCPRPLRPEETYFEVLGAPEKFELKLDVLERAFYTESKRFHPDRFGKAPPMQKNLSSQRMGFLNQAYQTLKDHQKRRDYLIQILGERHSSKDAPASIPLQITETWFDIQDVLTESFDEGIKKARAFQLFLLDELAKLNLTLEQFERALDLNPESEDSLLRLRADLSTLKYLHSLEKDVEKTPGYQKNRVTFLKPSFQGVREGAL